LRIGILIGDLGLKNFKIGLGSEIGIGDYDWRFEGGLGNGFGDDNENWGFEFGSGIEDRGLELGIGTLTFFLLFFISHLIFNILLLTFDFLMFDLYFYFILLLSCFFGSCVVAGLLENEDQFSLTLFILGLGLGLGCDNILG